ncbi:MAG: PQQ-binding-like beta-propeller repeat protein [bacterium]|jgi:outer membrane protein assembly factor BamB
MFSADNERPVAVRAALIVFICILAASTIVSCRGGGTARAGLPAHSVTPNPASADGRWLEMDGFRGSLLDRSLKATAFPELAIGLAVEPGWNATTLRIIQKASRLPDDLFLCVSYDHALWSFQSAEYRGGLGSDAIHAEIPAGSGTLHLGASRLADARGGTEPEGAVGAAVFEVRFARGAEAPSRRAANAPLQDWNKVTDLAASDTGGDTVLLTWRERNIGDYDNNGEVGIADITPIALHWMETPANTQNSEVFELIDGSGDGEISIPDITPIALNYLNRITGYHVYRSGISGPLPPGSSTRATTLRPVPEPGEGRLHYEWLDSPGASGSYTYTVRPFSDPLEDEPVGIESDPAAVNFTFHGGADVVPPVWDSGEEGVTDAIAGESSILLKWGRAVDAASPPVTYRIYLSLGDAVDFDVPDLVQDVDAGDPDDPEHTFQLWDLPAGSKFSVAVRARDSHSPPNEDQNTETRTVTLVENEGWLDFRGGSGRTGAAPGSLPPPLTLVFEHPLDPDGQSNTTPAIVAGASGDAEIALCAVGDSLFAYDISDPQNITERWVFPAGGPGEQIDSSPAVAADRVFVGSQSGYLYCLSLLDGTKLWEYPAGGNVPSSPVVVDDVVYCGTAQGELLMLSALDGRPRWTYGVDTVMASSPAVADGRVFVGSGTQAGVPAQIVSYDTSTGLDWFTNTPGGVRASPAVADGRVMVGDLNGRFYILTTFGASLHAPINLGGEINASAAYSDGIAYVSAVMDSFSSRVYAINVETGDFAWPAPATIASPPVRSSPLIAGNYLYVVDGNGKILAYDAATGAKLWEWSSGGPPSLTTGSPVVWNNRIYHQGADHALRAFDPTFDFDPPVWTGQPGLLQAGHGSVGQNVMLNLIAGDAVDLISPPVRWRYFLSDFPIVDFDGADGPTSGTISFGPIAWGNYTFNVADMNRAKAKWDAHRAWYAARALDSAFPPNEDDNEVTVDYTFPWNGEYSLYDAGAGEKIYTFDAASAGFYGPLVAMFKTTPSGWKLSTFKEGQLIRHEYDLLGNPDIVGLGYLDLEKNEADGSYALAAVVENSLGFKDLYIGTIAGATEQFPMAKLPTGAGHDWGTVSVAFDGNGNPAAANTYWNDLSMPLTLTELLPQYHYLSSQDPPQWMQEFIDSDANLVQTRYIDLAFKKDGTPVVAYTKSNTMTGGNTGLFVAERRGVADWRIVPVDGGSLTGTTGYHLSMILDGNDLPVIVYSDIENKLLKIALPVGADVWNIVSLGDINNGSNVHDGTCLIPTPGAGPGDGSADYALAHFSQFGSTKNWEKVFVRVFGNPGGSYAIPPESAYQLDDPFQPMDDSASIALVPEGSALYAYFAADFGARIMYDSIEMSHFLK